ncbi:hypothetical protein [Algoriphagus aquimarinus]|uniref:Lipoprotein n=1 Tax=Algoriphagus aquimarinus TaxID=237018 RepID=A0A5C7ANH0_9BACT|nr:hypothetical protein [Algoriphagus aquimarinus]TXE10310.1 hypothetical protein ESV85_13325 [Algoriphagus aquimarinus]
MIKALNLIGNILFACLFIYLTSCASYRYKANVEDEKTPTLSDGWSQLDDSNYLVVHSGDQMMELYEVSFNENEKIVSGKLKPFVGLPLEYYNKIPDKSRNKKQPRKPGKTDKDAVKQIHFMLTDNFDLSSNEISFQLAEIRNVALSKSATPNSSIVGIVAGSTVVAFGTFLAIACSCPHVFINDGDEVKKVNSLYTGAKASQLERSDLKKLPDYFSDQSSFSLTITNEENEDQFTNMVELVVVNHDENVTVEADMDGNIYTILKPRSSVSEEDSDYVLARISAKDESSYKFDSDVADGLSTISLEFQNPLREKTGKLVMNLKNTQWSGYVYNEFSSLFGSKYVKWIEKNEDKSKEEREQWMREQGIKLLVEMKTEEGWQQIDEIELLGDITYNSVVVPFEIKNANQNVEFRLKSGFRFWDLDFAGVDYSKQDELNVTVIKPNSATGNKGEDFLDVLLADDEVYMKHLGMDSSTELKFEGLPVSSEMERTVFLRAKGYYISKQEYLGKVDRAKLKNFKNPGELSRFSQELYQNVFYNNLVTK